MSYRQSSKAFIQKKDSHYRWGCLCRYGSDDQLPDESTCSERRVVSTVTVKEEREMPHDCLSTQEDDTLVILCFFCGMFYIWKYFMLTLLSHSVLFIRNLCRSCSYLLPEKKKS